MDIKVAFGNRIMSSIDCINELAEKNNQLRKLLKLTAEINEKYERKDKINLEKIKNLKDETERQKKEICVFQERVKILEEINEKINSEIGLCREDKEQEYDELSAKCEKLKKLVAEYDDRHQSDCIRINQLLVTIDTLADRYAKLREIHGL